MPKIDLLPCPFCGKLETLRMMYVPSEKHELVYNVVCNAVNGGCGASTGWNHETPEEAAKEWNTRTSGWIPCRERMPEAGETVLVYTHRRGVTLDFLDVYVSNGKRFFHNSDVTHWMPLPNPPDPAEKPCGGDDNAKNFDSQN